MHVEVGRLSSQALFHSGEAAECSADIRDRVVVARERQLKRQGKLNSALVANDVFSWCFFGNKERSMLTQVMESLGLSARACHRIVKVARTIADMDAIEAVRCVHLEEAVCSISSGGWLIDFVFLSCEGDGVVVQREDTQCSGWSNYGVGWCWQYLCRLSVRR